MCSPVSFVLLPSETGGKFVVFGKNSVRPTDEAQEVVYYPAVGYGPGIKLQCTYEKIEQIEHTYAIIVSKPAWTWGAEMGANECGVCISCAVVSTVADSDMPVDEHLLGQDLVRLGLERGASAANAVTVITNLLQQYGQGASSKVQPARHSSFLVADRREAWILESVGKLWAAKRQRNGCICLSDSLVIKDDFTNVSDSIEVEVQKMRLWQPCDGPFSFAKACSGQPDDLSTCINMAEDKERREKALLQFRPKLSSGKTVTSEAFSFLREVSDKVDSDLATVSSLVSILPAAAVPPVHWLTATPEPRISVFKPFIFCDAVDIGSLTVAPNTTVDNDVGDGRQALSREQTKAAPRLRANEGKLRDIMQQLENECVSEMADMLLDRTAEEAQETNGHGDLSEMKYLFRDVCQSEIKFYR